jgi:GNAT superfamily N-acetyltransferase
VSFGLASDVVEPKYPARKSQSRLDPYAEVLASWLTRESQRSRKCRRNLKQRHRDLVALGFDGSYDRVAAFARDWRQRERERAHLASRVAYVPLAFAPGEAFQFDWSEDWLVVSRKKTKLQIAHTKLCHSRAFHLRAYPTQTHEMLFDAHNHAFRVLRLAWLAVDERFQGHSIGRLLLRATLELALEVRNRAGCVAAVVDAKMEEVVAAIKPQQPAPSRRALI